jgi:hypothetical protein
MPIPMLNEKEWNEVAPLLRADIEHIKSHRAETQIGLKEALETLRFAACEKYFEITGFRETNPNAIWHHRLADFGPECMNCGHLLRTNKASLCANCGTKYT